MSEIDDWIAVGDPAERHLALAADDEGDGHGLGWQAVARFHLRSAMGDTFLEGRFRFWFFDELDRFREQLTELQQTLTGTASLRTVGGELELSLSPEGSRGAIRAEVTLRKTGIDSFEAGFGYAFEQSHLNTIIRDLGRQFPKAVQ